MNRLDRPRSYTRDTNSDELTDLINDKSNLAKLMSAIFTELNIKPNKLDIENIQQFIPQIDNDYLYWTYGTNIDKINDDIKKKYINYRKKLINEKQTDIHNMLNEILKGTKGDENKYGASKVNGKSVFTADGQSTTTTAVAAPTIDTSITNLVNIARILNFESLWKDVYIELDTRYQNLSNTDKSTFGFYIVSNTKTKQIGSGAITAIGDIRDIVQIEIGGFNIPYLAQADNFYKRVTMTIVPLVSDCYEAYENGQYHFSFKTTTNGNLIYLEPNRPEYRFKKPINRVGDFSIRFGSPLVPILFDKDRLNAFDIDYSANTGQITFGESHNLVSGDVIYVDNFNTLDDAKYLTLVNEITRPSGHTITRISNLIISINIDFSSIEPAFINTSQIVSIYFASKRIMIPLRIRYLYNGTSG